jgi:hypothetical protein
MSRIIGMDLGDKQHVIVTMDREELYDRQVLR